VRPLELRISGLRSYRAETIVDFADLNLVAIIGATGSGKSSLLEAITYALYGSATWSGKSPKALIADGAISMTVSLSFLADGQKWLITRKASRGAYPPSTQELQCLSDPGRAKIDGSSDVKARIVELIGLDYDGFKSCVLLPQGRFDQLLKATAADRVGILKGILGLEALNTTRGRAQELREVVSDRLEELRKARAEFMQDPHATHQTTAARITALTPRVDELRQLEQRVQTLIEDVRAHQADSDTAAQAAARLTEVTDNELLERLRKLERLEGDLTAIHQAAVTAAETAEREARTARTDVADAKHAGRDAAAITGLRGTLAAATAELEAIAETRTQLAGKQAELETDREKLAEDLEQVARLAREHEVATAFEQQTETAASRARADAAAMITLIETIAAARATLAGRETTLRDLQACWELAHRESEAALKQQEQAAAALKAANVALDDADRADAAARAALGCEPGDQCPVCTQELPATFQIPGSAADLAALRQAGEDAQAAERTAHATLANLRATEAQASTRVAEATTARDDAQAVWTALGATPLPGDLDPETVTVDPATIAALNDPAEQAAQRYKAARQTSKQASGGHQAAAAAVNATEHALARRADDLASDTAHVARREQNTRNRLRLVPDWIELPDMANPVELAACDAPLAEALRHAEELEDLATTTAAAATSRRDQLDAIKRRVQREVNGPANSERGILRSLSAEASRHREDHLPEAPPAAATVAQLLHWGEQIVAGADETLATLRASERRASAKAQATKAAGVTLLASAGFETSEELRAAVIDAAGDLKYATSEHERAAAQLEPVAKLDDLVAQAEQLRGGLRELGKQLADGKFVGYVVEQRQQALLKLASGIVGEVTGGRYGFTKDFDIVDRQTGASRTPDTLSGGETFLVSLALALGLVELADRSGGRLQALFLDEGFGSLDPDALDQALTALERRAETGRLIAMISHVPAIAERIEQVLQVIKTTSGSQVRLLEDGERDSLLFEDATQKAAAA
jgi:exonuclease SbcC